MMINLISCQLSPSNNVHFDLKVTEVSMIIFFLFVGPQLHLGSDTASKLGLNPLLKKLHFKSRKYREVTFIYHLQIFI